jgi:membrane protein YdbS with pleckstrin-like domain
MAHYSKFLREKEVLIGAVRRVWWAYAGSGALALLLVLLTSFLSVPLLTTHWLLQLLFLVLMVLSLWRVFALWMVWSHDALLLTDQRVIDIDQKGIIRRVVTDVPYARVLDITWSQQGVIETLTRCGGITITTASGSMAIEIRPIKRPKRVQELVRDLADIASRNIRNQKSNLNMPHRQSAEEAEIRNEGDGSAVIPRLSRDPSTRSARSG